MNNFQTKFFQDILPDIDQLDQCLNKINLNLEHYDLPAITESEGGNSLEQQFRKCPEGYGAFAPITEYIQSSQKLLNTFKDFSNRHSLSWECDIIGARERRKAERADYWILWFQKLIRWTFGIVLVVILYSSVVWLSEKYDFIKIPVRDWIRVSANK